MRKAYGFRCDKCEEVVTDTRSPFIAYGSNLDEGCDGLQEAIKEHDLSRHPTSDDWPRFTMLVFEPTAHTKRRMR